MREIVSVLSVLTSLFEVRISGLMGCIALLGMPREQDVKPTEQTESKKTFSSRRPCCFYSCRYIFFDKYLQCLLLKLKRYYI